MKQVLGIPIGRFRFKGRTKALVQVCAEFHAHPSTGLHAVQIARATGMSLAYVNELLLQTPELFVRLPKRDGITRFRLATRFSGQPSEVVDAFVRRAAGSESLTLYALVLIIVAVVAMGAAMSVPLFTSGPEW